MLLPTSWRLGKASMNLVGDRPRRRRPSRSSAAWPPARFQAGDEVRDFTSGKSEKQPPENESAAFIAGYRLTRASLMWPEKGALCPK